MFIKYVFCIYVFPGFSFSFHSVNGDSFSLSQSNFFLLIKFNISISTSLDCVFVLFLKTTYQTQGHLDFLPCYLPVLQFTFKYMIHSEFVFVKCIKYDYFFAYRFPSTLAPPVKRLSFSIKSSLR